MRAIYGLTLRQVLGRGRLAVMTVLAALPVLVAALIANAGDGPGVAEVERVVLDVLLAGSITPLVVLAIATPAFGNEIEDETLANLTLTPVSRWKIVVPKLLAPITVAGALVAASASVTSHLAFQGDPRAVLAVTTGALAGVALYASAFVWLGMVTSRAVAIGLAYVVLWEGLFTGFVSGARLFSVRHHTIALMHGLDGRRFAEADPLGFGVAVGVSAAVFAGFLWLSVRRLRRMDVP